ncbi:hypothetical protein [Pseudonocardia alni]|jgi:bacterioferritin-associated ferredoxin|uniref:hypothetical protein n=1 Tax=Pseudonocardia alni TaxID=33907 RepID=UPI0031DA8ED0
MSSVNMANIAAVVCRPRGVSTTRTLRRSVGCGTRCASPAAVSRSSSVVTLADATPSRVTSAEGGSGPRW